MYITAQMLKHACKDQRDIFKKEWPEGVEVNAGNLERAVELGLDINWFAYNFLPPEAWENYQAAEATARATALDAVLERTQGRTLWDPSIGTYFQDIVTALLTAMDHENY